jgi:drug/metabolite transporter (DMT)-like permease
VVEGALLRLTIVATRQAEQQRRRQLGSSTMTAVFGGLGAAFAWATTVICATRATRLIGVPSVLAWVMLTGLVLTLPWATFQGLPDVDATATLWLIVAGVGNCAGLLLVYSGLRIGKVGVIAPIVSTEGAVAAVIAVLAGEELGRRAGAALVVVAAGIVLVGMSHDSSDSGSSAHDLRAALFGGADCRSVPACMRQGASLPTYLSAGRFFRRESSASLRSQCRSR